MISGAPAVARGKRRFPHGSPGAGRLGRNGFHHHRAIGRREAEAGAVGRGKVGDGSCPASVSGTISAASVPA